MMDYSFEPKNKYKKYEYFRKSLTRDANYKEVVYCRSDIAFLRFLSDMNNKEIYSKYYAEKNRTMHIECAKICESEDRAEYMKKRYGVRSRRELMEYNEVGEE
jgi:hypothetical protein